MQNAHRREAVAFQGFDEFARQGIDLTRHAEGAIAQMATGPARDLTIFGRGQLAELKAVIFPVLGEGDVIDVEIEAHADSVGGDEKIHLAILVELDLGVAGPRAERAEDDGRSAALTPDQLGDGIDLVGREGDDGRAARQTGDLLLAGIGEMGQARPGRRLDAGQEFGEDTGHGARAEQHGLLVATGIQDAVGEDVAAFEIGRELHLVDGDEGRARLARHRFDRTDRIARMGRGDLLLAGDERDMSRAHPFADPGIDLPRQEPQRQADGPGGMGDHALDGQKGLAGVGRPENGDETGVGGTGRGRRGGRIEAHELVYNKSGGNLQGARAIQNRKG